MAPSKQSAFVNVGDVIAGKFKVERILGEGGMGIVVAARHLQLEERVALKFLRPEMTTPETVARFAQEARAAVKLKSEHVARVIDVGAREDGIPFIVMEYLRGKNLADLLNESGALPIEAAVELMIQACEGLAEAHARGIVHRDIKPENLFLVDHGDGWRTLKILDFGISKAALTGSVLGPGLSNVKTQEIMGSPCYMSPEQLRSTRSVDHRADLWSIGAVLFELLTGTTAYDADLPLTELIATILEQDPPRLSVLLPEAPQALEDAIDQCLDADRDRRFQNAAELAIALMPFAPKRSRVAVERATTVTRAAGLGHASLQVPSSVAPPPMEGGPIVSVPPQSVPGSRPSSPGSGPSSNRSHFGKYRLVASVSHSSLWDTFLAISRAGGSKLVVVKRLRLGLPDAAEATAAFLRQARLSVGLHHPNIVETFEAGEQDGYAYVVTEFLEGQSLEALTYEAKRMGVRIPPLLSARIVAEACAGLRYAHELADPKGVNLKVVHEHVNPRNVFLTYDGRTKLLDLGLVRAAYVSPATEALVRETRGYSAPEQGAGKSADWRVDTYGAGVILWELLADRRLVRAEAGDSALQRFAEEAAPLVADLVSDVEPELSSIVARAVAKNPATRFQTSRELKDLLERHLTAHAGPGPADVGELVRTLFPEAREQLEREIEASVQRADSGIESSIGSIAPDRRRRAAGVETGSGPRSTPPHSRPPASRRSGAVRAEPLASALGATGIVGQPSPSVEAAGSRRSPVLWVGLGGAVALVAVLLLVLRGGAARPADAATTTLSSSTAPAAAPVPPAPSAAVAPPAAANAVPDLAPAASAAAVVPEASAAAGSQTTPPNTGSPSPSARPVRPAGAAPSRPGTPSALARPSAPPDLDIRMHR